MKKNAIVIIVLIVILIGAGLYFMTRPTPDNVKVITDLATTTGGVPIQNNQIVKSTSTSVLGKSVQGRDITAYHYGTGRTELLFIGGIHGGYEWNTVLVAYQLMDYLKANPKVVPSNIKVTVIPVMNPDGLNKIVGTAGRFTEASVPRSADQTIPGRFNANNVDLGRNFDCDWQANAIWQNKSVSGGTAAFSEPESIAIKNYVESHKLAAVVTWYSAFGGVFASNCHSGVSTETNLITQKYSDASGYPASQSFDFYAITGDMVNWFAKKNIPAISVLLTNHTDTEWVKNQAGVEALLKFYTK